MCIAEKRYKQTECTSWCDSPGLPTLFYSTIPTMPDFKKQLDFISSAQIPNAPANFLERTDEAAPITVVLEEHKTQALVVGSEIVSFTEGVPAKLRESVTNCALLAQLVANNRVPNGEDVLGWYKVYFDSLKKLGWAVQQETFVSEVRKGQDFETHKAIMAIAAVVLGPGAVTALAVVTSTVTALQQVSGKNKKWLTIFKRESQKAKVARFQISVAEPAPGGGVVLTLMAFKLEAEDLSTQVLVFKFRSKTASFDHASGKISLATDLLQTIGPKVAEKVKQHAVDWIDSLGDL